MNWLQSTGFALMLFVVGATMIVASGVSEDSQLVHYTLLVIGVLCLMLGGAESDDLGT